MNRITSAVALALVAALAAGCASHAPLEAPDASFAPLGVDDEQVSEIEQSLTDRDIAGLLDANVRAKLPTNLAIAKIAGRRGYAYLDAISAEELNAWEETLPGREHIRSVEPISAAMIGTRRYDSQITLRDLRTAAARMDCELLLVCLHADSQVDNFNNAAALYWTFVGLWVVPGNVIEHQSIMQAIVVDCRTGVILGTATGDSRLSESVPAAYSDIVRDRLREQAAKDALADLQKGATVTLRRIAGSAVAVSNASGEVQP